jgi:uncharacterized membrane protein
MLLQNLPTDAAFTDSPDVDNRINTSLKNWILIAVAAIILMVTSWLSVGSFITKLILLPIQFGILIVSIIYFIKMWKWKKQSDKVTGGNAELWGEDEVNG